VEDEYRAMESLFDGSFWCPLFVEKPEAYRSCVMMTRRFRWLIPLIVLSLLLMSVLPSISCVEGAPVYLLLHALPCGVQVPIDGEYQGALEWSAQWGHCMMQVLWTEGESIIEFLIPGSVLAQTASSHGVQFGENEIPDMKFTYEGVLAHDGRLEIDVYHAVAVSMGLATQNENQPPLLGNIIVETSSEPFEPPPVQVSIDAPAEVTHCTNFTARVNVTEVTRFAGCQFDLTYDPSVLEGTDVTDGEMNSTAVEVGWSFLPVSTPGTIRVVGIVALPDMLSGINGTGYLAEIHFHAVGSACNTSNMTFSNVKLFDNLSGDITPVDWVDDSVHISAGVVVADCMAAPNPTLPGVTTTFSANATGGVGNYTWDWDFGDGNSSVLESPTYAYSTAGNYTVNVTVTDSALPPTWDSCEFTISVHEAINVTDCMADANPTKVGHNTTFSANATGGVGNYATGGVGNYTWAWDFGDGNNSTDESPVYAYTVASTYTVMVTVTDGLNNTDDCSFNITVNPPLAVSNCTADANPTKVGHNTTFSANATGGVGNRGWKLYLGLGFRRWQRQRRSEPGVRIYRCRQLYRDGQCN